MVQALRSHEDGAARRPAILGLQNMAGLGRQHHLGPAPAISSVVFFTPTLRQIPEKQRCTSARSYPAPCNIRSVPLPRHLTNPPEPSPSALGPQQRRLGVERGLAIPRELGYALAREFFHESGQKGPLWLPLSARPGHAVSRTYGHPEQGQTRRPDLQKTRGERRWVWVTFVEKRAPWLRHPMGHGVERAPCLSDYLERSQASHSRRPDAGNARLVSEHSQSGSR